MHRGRADRNEDSPDPGIPGVQAVSTHQEYWCIYATGSSINSAHIEASEKILLFKITIVIHEKSVLLVEFVVVSHADGFSSITGILILQKDVTEKLKYWIYRATII